MKKSFIYTVIAGALLFSTNLMSSTKATASSDRKSPGGIVFGIPSGCDCTIPANTCYCVISTDPQELNP